MHYSGSSNPPQYTTLRQQLRDIADIEAILAILSWDRTTYMPAGGAIDRGRQSATLQRLLHQKATVPELGELLDSLQDFETSRPYSSIEASTIRIARHDYQRRVAVPSEFTARLTEHQIKTYGDWARAREADNFKIVQPALEKMLDLSLEFSSFFPHAQHPADPAIARADRDTNAHQLRALFRHLRSQLLPLIDAIHTSATPASDALLRQEFDITVQQDFCRKLIERIGYDFKRGRIDTTLHPFTVGFGTGDVRITNRAFSHDLHESLFSTLHEMGHGLYEQGLDPALSGTPLAAGASSGMHESQSRLWENIIGRSRAFWECCFPWLQGAFIRQLGKSSVRDFYAAVNTVSRTPIRTRADEVTYNLHIIIRFELELAMLEGKLAIADLPEAWNAAYQQDLGITPTSDLDGVLQDVHWYTDRIGGQFQGYALGNLIAAQLYETALRTHPEIPVDLERGRFSTLHQWLQSNIYRHGCKFSTTELLERVTGRSLQVEPFITLLREKYTQLYRLK
jgi:carboxypeptidase Taq